MSRTWREQARHREDVRRAGGGRRACPVAGCANRITPGEPMCGADWYLVPEPLKKAARADAGQLEAACRAVEAMKAGPPPGRMASPNHGLQTAR